MLKVFTLIHIYQPPLRPSGNSITMSGPILEVKSMKILFSIKSCMLLAMVDFFLLPCSRAGGILTLKILCIAIHEKK